MTRLPGHAAFATGLAALAWVAWGALGDNPIALAVTAVMAAFFVTGALELRRFDAGSRALRAAADAPPSDGVAYDAWLAALPAPLPDAVRQRVDHGGRGALPGPALAPALTGLLVLLGMLGTFIGMVATLHGTGLAVENAAELDALRAALAAPVKGLGLAFGTSVAGVATSAMLGLMTALARRERAGAVQALDRTIATALKPFSAAHRASLQHDETLRALQRQADAVPGMVTTMVDTVVVPLMDRLQTMMAALQQQHDHAQQRLLDGEQRLQQRLIDGQAQFHARAEAGYGALSDSVERSLKASLADGAREAHARLQPLLESTMGGLARETGQLHAQLSDTLQRQLEAITTRLSDHGAQQAAHWQQALDAHRQRQQVDAEQLRSTLDAFTTTMGTLVRQAADQHARLAEGAREQTEAIALRLAEHGSAQAAQWRTALDEHRTVQQDQVERLQGALSAFTAAFDDRSTALVQTLATRLAALQDGQRAEWADQDGRRLDAWRDTVSTMTGALHDAISTMSTDLRDTVGTMTAALRDTTASMSGDLHDRTAAMTGDLRDTVATMTGELRDTVATMTGDLRGSVATMATDLRDAWQTVGERTAERQQQICDALAETARSITETTQSQARATVDEIARLLQSAAEAPRAAAEVIGELRERLTEAMARDDASLRERERLMATLGTLLGAVTEASTAQRDAIEALVGTAATLLQQAGERLQAQADHQGAALADAATRAQASAVEMASLGEAFGFAVQRFGESNEALMGQLQRIEAALSQTLTRSDEQLNYYVAQAREVIDLSLTSQKQILEDLQMLTRREAA